MRYVAKIHVLDVMDEVVVSGYVYDSDGPVRDGEAPLEFTYSAKGVGLSEPLPWLLNSLYRCLVSERDPGSRRGVGASSLGGAYTISETGDIAVDRVGLTVVGGLGGGDEPGSRSDSAPL